MEENLGRIVMEEAVYKSWKEIKSPPSRLVSGLPQNREPSLGVVIMIDVFHIQNHLRTRECSNASFRRPPFYTR